MSPGAALPIARRIGQPALAGRRMAGFSFLLEAVTAMGEREIRAKYGGHLAKAINRAIRAEVDGGNEALERLTQLAGAARQSRWTDRQGRPTPEAAAYFRHKREVVGGMD